MLRAEVDEVLRATKGVEGWLFPVDAYLIGLVDAIQKTRGITGNLFEIGVHHGKSAILLARAATGTEVLGVCDVFEDQSANLDHSGEGSRHLFLANLRRLSNLPPERVRVFGKRSDQLTGDDTTGECRLFHIDGGHRPDDVRNDLELAARAILPEGVVILDDAFNPSWPGVSEGLYGFALRDSPPLVPFLIGGNKVFLARPGAATIYARHLASDAEWRAAVGDGAFVRESKAWLGREVHVAGRTSWVDLDPLDAARRHLGAIGWRERLRILLG